MWSGLAKKIRMNVLFVANIQSTLYKAAKAIEDNSGDRIMVMVLECCKKQCFPKPI